MYLEGRHDVRIDALKIKLLDSIGFVWDPPYISKDNNAPRTNQRSNGKSDFMESTPEAKYNSPVKPADNTQPAGPFHLCQSNVRLATAIKQQQWARERYARALYVQRQINMQWWASHQYQQQLYQQHVMKQSTSLPEQSTLVTGQGQRSPNNPSSSMHTMSAKEEPNPQPSPKVAEAPVHVAREKPPNGIDYTEEASNEEGNDNDADVVSGCGSCARTRCFAPTDIPMDSARSEQHHLQRHTEPPQNGVDDPQPEAVATAEKK
jgi:hypothetical protein